MNDKERSKEELFTVEALHFQTGTAVRLVIDNGYIRDVEDIDGASSLKPDLFVAPGLIDNQINGYSGVDFSSDDVTPEKVKLAAERIWSDGVTTFIPTVITNSHENLLLNFRNLYNAIIKEDLMGSVPGFHLEGPYISPEEGFFGTHPEKYVRKPDWNEFIEYQEAAGGKIIQVTVSPEVEGADVFIEKCKDKGIIVAIGHTNANAGQVRMAAEKGARLSTHLGNGCANMIHRHHNHLWPQLAEDRLIPTIIADGHHLPEEVIKVFVKVKGPDKIILTSDVNHLIGMPPGKYNYLGTEVVYSEDGLVRNPGQNCLAGASMPLVRGVETVMNYTGCPLGEAINMASKNVADVYGFNDRGLITPGKRADLILFSLANNKLSILKTWIKGKLVYSAT
jgi:N-acetylglucosamine-6-phosphate deacetylase